MGLKDRHKVGDKILIVGTVTRVDDGNVHVDAEGTESGNTFVDVSFYGQTLSFNGNNLPDVVEVPKSDGSLTDTAEDADSTPAGTRTSAKAKVKAENPTE